ncbi:hypothetical protein CHRYSEO8AT_290067 [Chryseobacterium sp. 8AT]|nr:hypothetical protein CHRYSEO8AT_290067 [Chryseobacterium sp. 8AT]
MVQKKNQQSRVEQLKILKKKKIASGVLKYKIQQYFQLNFCISFSCLT